MTYPDLSLTLPISLLPFSVTSGSYLLLVVSGLISIAPYYLERKVTSFLLTMGFSLVFLDYTTYLIVPFLVLVPTLVYLKVEVRGFFGTFFVFLISAAVFFNQALSDQLSSVAYYSLLFGVIGVILENRRVRLRAPLLFVPYALGSLLFPTPLEYYWWNPHSFYFSSNPFSLWLVSGYFPQVNTILGTWPLSHLLSVRLYIALLALLSGEASYFLFKRLGIPKPWLPALVYQLLSPFPYPYLLLGYSVLPVTGLLLTLKVRNEIKYPAIMVSSMIGSSFPFFLISAGLLSVREKNFPWLILGMVGANAFWLLPYLIFGFPTESVEITSSFALLIPVLVLLAKFERGKVIVPLLSLIYMLSGLPLSYAFYPIAILSTLLLFKDTDIRKVASAVIVSILLLGSFLQFSHYSVAQVPSNITKIDGEIENATLVWWNDSYPLLSSAPINFTQLPLNFIQYVISHGKVMKNVNYTGFPVSVYPLPPNNVIQVNGSWVPETIPIPFNFSEYNKTSDLLVNGSLITSISSEQRILWKAPNESFVVNFSGNWTSYLPYPAVILGSNSTFVEVWLGGHYPVYLFGRETRLLGTAEPVNLPGKFSLSLAFARVGNFTFLEGEKVGNRFYPFFINTTLPWKDAREFGLELPIRNQVSLNVSLNKFVPINITRDYVSWNSTQPTT
ncbi:hypothetical protein [Metallosphaera hakonensis]|uniref:hypothetical protein n=1 Tax=Metallosphaera hakonensis TaxID=79601 RepID=UPI0006D09A6D|nr:hypothetical protein [Metallosphaera hakonensis]